MVRVKAFNRCFLLRYRIVLVRSTLDHIFQMCAEFLSYPNFALRCEMSNVTPLDGQIEFSDGANQAFRHYLQSLGKLEVPLIVRVCANYVV